MSDKSIAQKLFIKPTNKVLLVNPPAGYLAQMDELPAETILLSDTSCLVEVIQVFVVNRAELEAQLPRLKGAIGSEGEDVGHLSQGHLQGEDQYQPRYDQRLCAHQLGWRAWR